MRYSILITGRVQGVGFRYFVSEKARQNEITGWVKNMPDGSVRIEAQGAKTLMDIFVRQIKIGPKFSKIQSLSIEIIEEKSNEKTFVITQ